MSLFMMDEEEESKKYFNYDKIVEYQNLSKKKKKQFMKKKELLEDDFEVIRDKSYQFFKVGIDFKVNFGDKKLVQLKLVLKCRRKGFVVEIKLLFFNLIQLVYR